MKTLADTSLIRKNFSQASETYDKFSLIQQRIADELFLNIDLLSSQNWILDIGIGTGYLTRKVKLHNPYAKIFGLDLALGMLRKTRQKISDLSLIQADASTLPFKDNTFDLILSNLTFQWIKELKVTFQQIKSILKEEARCYFTIFSENTLSELREIIGELYPGTACSQLYLPHKDKIKELLQEVGFRKIRTYFRLQKEYYSGLWELLNWLKLTGANRYWSDKFFKGLCARRFINQISQKYERRFIRQGKIFATFEILFVELVK